MTKNYFLLTALIAISYTSFSQCIIFNGGFEDWEISSDTNNSNQPYSIDVLEDDSITERGWFSLNDAFSYEGDDTATLVLRKTSDAHTGNFAARVDAVPGGNGDLIYAGNCNGVSRPQSLNGYFKNNGFNFDDAFVINVYMLDVEPLDFVFSNDTSNVIGSGESFFSGPQAQYMQFSIPITYKNNMPSDSVLITVNSLNSDSNSVKTSLILDDFTFSNVTSVSSLDNYNQSKLYPNPVSEDYISIVNEGVDFDVTEIYSLDGQLVLTTVLNTGIDISSLSKGAYYVIQKNEGIIISKNKLVRL